LTSPNGFCPSRGAMRAMRALALASAIGLQLATSAHAAPIAPLLLTAFVYMSIKNGRRRPRA
jgi:hypothetical protein